MTPPRPKSSPLAAALSALAVAVFQVFLDGWVVMLMFGALHSAYPAIPAISYPAAIAGKVLVQHVLGGAKR